MALKLIIGNKNYSSWSFRPWIAMKGVGIAFEEELIPFGQPIGNPEFKSRIANYSPAGKVPVLVDGDVHVWETIAILEYLAEKFSALWPVALAARAHARAICAEMHAGFQALRGECPMNFRRPPQPRELSVAAHPDVKRIEVIWTECRERYGGPFLFGRFGAADAMFAPVVARFHTYAIPTGREALAYMQAVVALPAWVEWKTEAVKEAWVVAEDEIDWPTVSRI